MLKIFLIALILPSTLFLAIAFFSPIFKVRNVEVTGSQNCLNPNQVFDEQDVKNARIFFLSAKKLEESLKNSLECIDKIQITKIWPAKLRINVESRQAVARIEDGNYLVAVDGLVIGSAQTSSLPTIFTQSKPNLDQNNKISDENVLFALTLTRELSKSDFLPTNIRFVDVDNIAVYNQEGQVALFTTKKSAERQTDTLQQVLSKAKIDSTKIAKIDLRFDKPVLVYK